MTFEADLFTALKGADGAIGTRVYPGFAPVSTIRPYITFQQIGGPVLNQVSNDATGVRRPEIQVNVWADTKVEAMRLAHAIEAAMRAATAFMAVPIDEPVDDFDADLPVYCARQDFRCRHTT